MSGSPITRPSLLLKIRDPGNQLAWNEFVAVTGIFEMLLRIATKISHLLMSKYLVFFFFLASLTAADKPKILIVLVDDMGYGDAGCYNPKSRIPTPHIDSLAQAGMRFTDAHSPGAVCHPSRYGLLTGQYPFRANTGAWRKRAVIDEGRMTIASLLKSQGYRTAMVGKWHLGFAQKGYENPLSGGPVDRGFETYFGIRASTARQATPRQTHPWATGDSFVTRCDDNTPRQMEVNHLARLRRLLPAASGQADAEWAQRTAV